MGKIRGIECQHKWERNKTLGYERCIYCNKISLGWVKKEDRVLDKLVKEIPK